MVAQGLLNNPALFHGCSHTPIQCVRDWLDICDDLNVHFTPFHNHLVYMLSKVLPRPAKRVFNDLRSKEAVLDFLKVYLNGEKELGKLKINKVPATLNMQRLSIADGCG